MTDDLFAETSETSASAGLAAFRSAWDGWLADERRAGRLQRQSSVDVYAHMWAALSGWCVSQGLGLDAVQPQDLRRFIRSRGGADDVSARHAWRLLRLFERVATHRAENAGQPHNRAATRLLASQPDYRHANAADKDPPPLYLPASEAKRLVTYLSAVRPGRTDALRSWQEVRNRAAVALMLGAGATPGELRALDLAHVVLEDARQRGVPWKLRVAGHAGAPPRETPIAGWAGQVLACWLAVRQQQGIPAPRLFPSTRSGKPWSKVAQYNATQEVLRAAGLDDVEGGSFRLRHTFVLRQLRRGTAPAEVARWIGVSDPAVMARYLRVLPGHVDVV